jgi:hypothetical protein
MNTLYRLVMDVVAKKTGAPFSGEATRTRG